MSEQPIIPEQPSENLRDLVEPADAKTKVVETRKRPFPTPAPPLHREEHRDSIFSTFLAARTLGMNPIARRQDFLINYGHLEHYFTQLYVDLLDLIFPTQPAPPNIITEQQFVDTCKWLVCMRIQYVQRRKYNIVPRYATVEYRPTFLVPTPLARVLRGLGSVMKMNGAVECAPSVGQARSYTAEEIRTMELDPLRADALALRNVVLQDPDELVKRIEDEVVASFTRFVSLMHRRGTSYVECLGDDPNAVCPWYLHGVLRNNVDPATGQTTVVVVSFDTLATPEDLLVAAIIQRQFNGQLVNGPGILIESDPITDALGLRSTFNTAC